MSRHPAYRVPEKTLEAADPDGETWRDKAEALSAVCPKLYGLAHSDVSCGLDDEDLLDSIERWSTT